MNPSSISLIRPDDWHLHLRDGAMLSVTVPAAARYFGRVIVMPNLAEPVVRTEQAQAYRDRILARAPSGSAFEPLMTLYLTDQTSPDQIKTGHAENLIRAVKYYPAGATTNSASGVTDLRKTYKALEAMQECGMPLLLHGEVTDPDIDIFDREAVFIERHLGRLMKDFPDLRMVLEHITTQQAVSFVTESGPNLAATITAHHLLFNRNHMLVGRIRPHYYCLPILKRDIHQQALLEAATSGNTKFFLGSDSAPHLRAAKESNCGCAGCYTGHATLELYAEAFEARQAMDRLEAFASLNGPAFYRLPANQDRIQLVKESWQPPESIEAPGGTLHPLRGNQPLQWKVAGAPAS